MTKPVAHSSDIVTAEVTPMVGHLDVCQDSWCFFW